MLVRSSYLYSLTSLRAKARCASPTELPALDASLMGTTPPQRSRLQPHRAVEMLSSTSTGVIGPSCASEGRRPSAVKILDVHQPVHLLPVQATGAIVPPGIHQDNRPNNTVVFKERVPSLGCIPAIACLVSSHTHRSYVAPSQTTSVSFKWFDWDQNGICDI